MAQKLKLLGEIASVLLMIGSVFPASSGNLALATYILLIAVITELYTLRLKP